MTGKNDDHASPTGTQAQPSATDVAVPRESALQARNRLRAWSQHQIELIDNAIGDARTKSAAASAEHLLAFERALRDVLARRAMVNREISRLASQSEGGISRFMDRLRTDLNDLTTRVDKMRASL